MLPGPPARPGIAGLAAVDRGLVVAAAGRPRSRSARLRCSARASRRKRSVISWRGPPPGSLRSIIQVNALIARIRPALESQHAAVRPHGLDFAPKKLPSQQPLAGDLRGPRRGLYLASARARLRRDHHQPHRRAGRREHRLALRVLPRQGRDRRAGGRAAGAARARRASRRARRASWQARRGRRRAPLDRADPRDRRAREGAGRRSSCTRSPTRTSSTPIQAIGARLLEFSQQVRWHAGGFVRRDLSDASLHLLINLVTSTILQASSTRRRTSRAASCSTS